MTNEALVEMARRFKLSRVEKKVAIAMGLSVDISEWTQEKLENVYRKWEVAEEAGKENTQIIEEESGEMGVSFQAVHSVHAAIAAAYLLIGKKN
jgi:hypothetical protein